MPDQKEKRRLSDALAATTNLETKKFLMALFEAGLLPVFERLIQNPDLSLEAFTENRQKDQYLLYRYLVGRMTLEQLANHHDSLPKTKQGVGVRLRKALKNLIEGSEKNLPALDKDGLSVRKISKKDPEGGGMRVSLKEAITDYGLSLINTPHLQGLPLLTTVIIKLTDNGVEIKFPQGEPSRTILRIIANEIRNDSGVSEAVLFDRISFSYLRDLKEEGVIMLMKTVIESLYSKHLLTSRMNSARAVEVLRQSDIPARVVSREITQAGKKRVQSYYFVLAKDMDRIAECLSTYPISKPAKKKRK